MPPGQLLLSIVDFFYSPKYVEGTFKPLIADLQYEYFEALKSNRQWKAKWIRVRYCWAFAKAMGLSKALSVIKKFLDPLGIELPK
ncbi:MAG: hypothetical protein L0220_14155 [Acidobacteria bacterium]|nr:hypothetical protein [Acidobacteriota bacterium]